MEVSAINSISKQKAKANILFDGGYAKLFKIDTKRLHRGSGAVDILVGIDHARLHGGNTLVNGNFPVPQFPLGAVVFGAGPDGLCSVNRIHLVRLNDPVDLTSFWSTEQMGVEVNPCYTKRTPGEKLLSSIENEEAKIIRDSAVKVGQQWMIPIPWAKDPNELPDNYRQALDKLESIEKRLLKNKENAKMYDDQILEMEKHGHAKKLTQMDIEQHNGPVHYISHHAVIKPEKKFTPFRVVFNAAAKYHGHVLNEYMLKGPDLLNDLVGVLLRFRENHVAILGDVSKMYHQVLVDPVVDAHSHRFLWRSFETVNQTFMLKQFSRSVINLLHPWQIQQ